MTAFLISRSIHLPATYLPLVFQMEAPHMPQNCVDLSGSPVIKNLPASAGDMVQSLVQEDPTCRGQLSLCITTTEPTV